MSKKNGESKPDDAAKRVRKVYELIRKQLRSCHGNERRAMRLLNHGKAYLQLDAKRSEISQLISEQERSLRDKLEAEHGFLELTKDWREAQQGLHTEFAKLEKQFDRIAIRVESGRNPEKILDALLALAEQVGVIDPLPASPLTDENGIPL